VNVGIVGAGPAGSLAAYLLARRGVSVSLFDPTHPREKPCGGGLTGKALSLLPAAPVGDPLPARELLECRFEAGDGAGVDVRLQRPVKVAARRDLDAWLLRRAVAAGAQHIEQRVVHADPGGELVLRPKQSHATQRRRFDVIIGADGASSRVRRAVLGPLPRERLMMAAGWYARGTAPMLVRFMPGLHGYLWLFPRPDHVCVGICAPLGDPPSRDLLGRLETEVSRSFPALRDFEGTRYAQTIPSPGTNAASLREIAGERWALIGDAAALADPLTGEGIYYALRSAELLSDTLLAGGSPAEYADRALKSFGAELLTARRIGDRFYAPGFTNRMIRYARRSPTIRGVLGDLVLGDQGYRGLTGRLLRVAPRFLWESATSRA
jgi:flavin-dependent dehydrogenase